MTLYPNFIEPVSPGFLPARPEEKPDPGALKIAPHLYRFQDTCNVYAVLEGQEAVLVDFGDGSVLQKLAGMGLTRASHVLMTHHHRDQGQGLRYAVQAGARIWVPDVERDLFEDVEAHWQGREIYNDYNVRQDRFSLLEPVPVAGTLKDYSTFSFGPHVFTVLPTPGHTVGSISLWLEIDGLKIAFTGDLIAAPGKVWSMSATQWSYNGAEGVAASIASLLDLKERKLDILLPSHGDPITDPGPAIDLLVDRLWQILSYRRQNPRLFDLYCKPYEPIPLPDGEGTGASPAGLPHLLKNRTSASNSYVLLSESGNALFIDFGYDFMTGFAAGSDRASRRPWLYTLGALKRDYGVQKVEVVIPTHYHDDHVAGFNLLRDVEGTEVWAPANFSYILENPSRYDLPCLWYDPIPVDRVLSLGRPFRWQEYELTLYPLPGHTRFAVAISFTVDGRRVLAVGDQYQGDDGVVWNYVYRNQFQIDDYRHSAELYQKLAPDLILPGHAPVLWTGPEYFTDSLERGEALECLHRELLPLEAQDFGAEGFGARIFPYQVTGRPGEWIELNVEVRNPFGRPDEARVELVAPAGWEVAEKDQLARIDALSSQILKFWVRPPEGSRARRARIAVDLTVGGRRFGQQAEALISLEFPSPARPRPAVRLGDLPEPLLDQDFPDPSLLKAGSTYYAYATNSGGQHVQAACSPDLLHWETLPDALPDLPAWAVQDFKHTWSPCVAPAAGVVLVVGETPEAEMTSAAADNFVLYYVTRFALSGNTSPRGIQAIGAATSASPAGPFRPVAGGPLICQMEEGGSIDPAVFADEDGSRYLLWKNDGNSCAMPTWIYIQRLSTDGLALEGEPVRLIAADLDWEGPLIEAPNIWKHCGKYYLFYSANNFTSPRYAIGYAVADNPWGPYRKAEAPLLASNRRSGWLGPGGQDVIAGPDGEPWMFFHAWAPGGYRGLNAARLAWDHDRPAVVKLSK